LAGRWSAHACRNLPTQIEPTAEEAIMRMMQSRRRFLAGATLAGAAGLIGGPKSLHAEPPPETTTVRLTKLFDSTCEAAKNVAQDLLRAEGFTDVRYVEGESGVDTSVWMSRGEVDFDYNFPPTFIASIDAGVPTVVLTGMHSGCLELIANDSIRSVKDLKGKRVGIDKLTSHPHVLVTIMAANVGLDPARDIQWVEGEETPMQLFIDGKIDAFLGTAPEPQLMRARKIGHPIVNTSLDRPWSQYYCCMLASTVDYVARYPVATKRVMRALLKAADLCVSNPQWVAQQMVDGGFASQYELALETLSEVRYDRWREYDPEDTLRFFALRMHEAGFIKSGPNEIIAAGTEWRFLDELKRELKT
jgi:NitT/TauT family transport system substrate-binding protein